MMQGKTTWIAAAAGTLLCAALAAQPERQQQQKPAAPGAHEESATMNFDKDPTGKLPSGWKAAQSGGRADPKGDPPADPAKPVDPGKFTGGVKPLWTVAADPTAPSRPNVLEIMGATQGVNGYNICICEEHSEKDVDLTAKVRGNTGKAEQGGGVAWRVRNPENFYACSYNPADGKFRVFKVLDGREQELGSANFKGSGPDASTWYTIGARMSGDTISCSINGQELLHATDATLKDAGHIGLWTRADAASSFDDVTIKAAAAEHKDMPKKNVPPGAIPPKGPPIKGG